MRTLVMIVLTTTLLAATVGALPGAAALDCKREVDATTCSTEDTSLCAYAVSETCVIVRGRSVGTGWT